MKCIKLIRQSKGRELGEIMRTSDSDAELRVKGGNWGYVPKSEWKDYNGKVKKTEQVTEQVTDQEGGQVRARRGKRANAN
jgi:hypothetical protein